MKKISLVVLVILALCALIFVVFKTPRPNPLSGGERAAANESLPISATITTPMGEKIEVRVADDPAERQLGLSYFKTLPDDQGMLFLFEKLGNYPFWMKDMNFPIDIVWLRRTSADTFEVVYIAEGVDPSTYPQTIDPKTDADAVLEVGAGRAKNFGIVEGVLVKM